MDLIVVGVNHRSAPVEMRERLDFSKRSPKEYLPKLTEVDSLQAGLVLSTCNRVELYATGSNHEELYRGGVEFLQHYHEGDQEEIRPFLYHKTNEEAVRHLFRVAASLDSMIVGEPQILGQVKEAYLASSTFAFTDAFLDRLFRKTFSVAKRVRTETGIAQQAVSVSFAAVELAKKIFGDLSRKKVMVVGAGEMAELAARHFQRQSVAQIIFSNRSYNHSVDLAKEYGGLPVPFGEFPSYMDSADIVLVSTAAPHYLIHKDQVQKALATRKQEPMFFIDISVPRNVDPVVHDVEDVYLYNIDDLQGIVSLNLRGREKEAEKASAIIDFEVQRFFETLEKLKVAPVIQELQEKYENVRHIEMERLMRRLSHLSSEEYAMIEKATETIMRRMLHDPIMYLKDEKTLKQQVQRIDVLREIFALQSLDEGDAE